VVASRPIVDSIRPHVNPITGMIPIQRIPRCEHCGAMMFINVRGGDWFIHDHYEAANHREQQWIADIIRQQKRLVIIEVGCGYNTPTVTRFPMEALARQYQHAAMIRINIEYSDLPTDIQHGNIFALSSLLCYMEPVLQRVYMYIGVSLPLGAIPALGAIRHAISTYTPSQLIAASVELQQQRDSEPRDGERAQWRQFERRYGKGSWDWQRFLSQLNH
jgi:hypothetical protein